MDCSYLLVLLITPALNYSRAPLSMRKYTQRNLSRRRVIYRWGSYRAGRSPGHRAPEGGKGGHERRISYRTQKSKLHFTAACSSFVLLPVLRDKRPQNRLNQGICGLLLATLTGNLYGFLQSLQANGGIAP